MLTGFITSRLPPPLLSQGRLLRVYIAASLLLLSRPLSFSPHSPTSLTFNQRYYEQKWSVELNCHSNIASKRQTFKIHKQRGAGAQAYVSTEQHLHGVNFNRRSDRGGLTGGGQGS